MGGSAGNSLLRRSLAPVLLTLTAIALASMNPSLEQRLSVGILVAKDMAIAVSLLNKLAKEKQVKPVVSKDLGTWPVPDPEAQGLKGKRIIWGYWDSPETMPDICRATLTSWKVRNAGWEVIMMNKNNYRHYVAPSDLPSTFDSLIAQHQADVLRVAVLVRYGGVYMDISTFLYRGLDEIWNNLDEDALALTSMYRYPGTILELHNNAILIANNPHNTVLAAWHKQMIHYLENPAKTKEEMMARPCFARVSAYWNDESLSVLADVYPYTALLWLLNDIIWHSVDSQEHVVYLPFFDWGMFFFVFSNAMKQYQTEKLEDGALAVEKKDLLPSKWTAAAILQDMLQLFYYSRVDDNELFSSIVPRLSAIKFSSHGLSHVMTAARASTVASILEAATNLTLHPNQQATLKGSWKIKNNNTMLF